MKRLYFLVSILMGAVLCLATMSWAGEASVFDNVENIIIRAYASCTGGACFDGTINPSTYSVYLEVRDSTGALLVPEDLSLGVTVLDVTGTTPSTPPVDLLNNRYVIHNNTALSPDISMSLDNELGTLYLFCTDGELMVMKYNIKNNNIVTGACGATLNTCTSGTLEDVTDSTTNYLWNCNGANGGTNASCSLPKPVNGVCGTTLNTCTTGTLEDVTDSPTNYLWNCNGANGGENASCSLPIPTGSPDLTISASGAPGSFEAGMNYSFSVTARNQGNAPADKPFTVKFTMNASGTAGTGGTTVWTINSLAAGESVSNSVRVVATASCAIHTKCYFVFKVDGDDQISESKETNNVSASGSGRAR